MGMQDGAATMENSKEVPQILKIEQLFSLAVHFWLFNWKKQDKTRITVNEGIPRNLTL